MTDRAQAFIVVLDDDYRIGDTMYADNVQIPIGADAIQQSLRMIKGVASVEPIVADLDAHLARARVRSDIRIKLYEEIDRVLKGD